MGAGNNKYEQQRTCALCRKPSARRDLVRFVLAEEFLEDKDSAPGSGGRKVLMVDVLQTMPGRGVYCHQLPGCLLAKNTSSVLSASLKTGSGGRGRKRRRNKTQGEEVKVVVESIRDVVVRGLLAASLPGGQISPLAEKLQNLRSWIERELAQVAKPGGITRRDSGKLVSRLRL